MPSVKVDIQHDEASGEAALELVKACEEDNRCDDHDVEEGKVSDKGVDNEDIVSLESEIEGNKVQNPTANQSTQETPSAQEEPERAEGTLPPPIIRFIKRLRYLYSAGLLAFSVVLIMAAVFSEQTVGTADHGMHPVLAVVVFWFLIIWLAFMEGGQGCLVGLQPVDKDLYRKSHPRALKSTAIAHKEDTMERFIVGRQFLVVLVLFVSSWVCGAIPDANVLDLNDTVQSMFLTSGVALILITIMIGQLTAQVNSANCMLDFINNYFTLYFVTYASLAIEFSGILHCAYLVQMLFADKKTRSNVPSTHLQTGFFWGRVMFSTSVLAFAFAVTLSALIEGKTTMWEGVPSVISIVVFFVLMCFVGVMEGMQIALFAVVNMPEEKLAHHAIAKANCDLVFRKTNWQAFLIGRQICVTVCTFAIARITTLNVEVGKGENVFDVADGVQNFFNTGLLGALVTTIVASLIWRIIASACPIAFLSNPLVYVIIRLCLLLEASGLCSSAWLLAKLHRQMAGFQRDEVYIGASADPSSNAVEGGVLEDPSKVIIDP